MNIGIYNSEKGAGRLKRVMGILLIVILALTACNSELGITELKSVPNNVQKVTEQLGIDDYVQKIYVVDKDFSYIVINTKGTVTVSVESNDDTVSIKIEDEEGQNEEVKQHVYKLTTDRDYEYVQLYKNGEAIPFNVVTAI